MRLLIDIAQPACHAPFFGLTLLERHLRVLARSKAAVGPVILSGPTALPPLKMPRLELEIRQEDGSLGQRVRRALVASSEPLLVLDGASLVDPRLIAFLLGAEGAQAALHGEGAERAAVLCLTPDLAGEIDEAGDSVLALADALVARGRVPVLAPQAMPSFIANLRRDTPYWLFNLPDEASRRARARWLFRINYKGSTDFLTRWIFPPLVWPLVRLCTRYHVHPNWITLLSVVLAFAVVPLFAMGAFFWGFLLGYLMCVLDSVDGKVARLTLTDSRLGNLLDHGLDIVHPPLWYAAWAWGLGARTPDDPLFQAALWLIGFYVADRLVLGVAKARFKRGLHAMTALDGKVRSWIARRNVNMAIMTVALLIGQGPAGFMAVTLWQGATLLWHCLRTASLPRPAQRVGACGEKPDTAGQGARGVEGSMTAAIEILPVEGGRMLDRFIRLPHRLHRDDPGYIAPLDSEQRKALSPRHNPLFQHAEVAFWLARRGGRDVGRISAQVDRQALAVRPDATGYFGMVAAEDDPAIFAALLRTAEAWLSKRGMRRVLGPYNLSINEQVGVLVEGFERPPMLLMNHDRPYVGARLEEQGYAREKDLLAYIYDLRGELPPVVRRLVSRPLPEGMRLRQADVRRYEAEIQAVSDIFNDAWAGNWGFVPLTEAEIEHLAKALKPILIPRLVWFVEMRGEPIAFIVCLPNLNEAIRDLGGRLLPFGWIKLLWRLKVAGVKTIRVPLMGVKRQYATGMWAGVLPFALINAAREEAKAMGMHQAELSWVLEDNTPMRHIGDALGGSADKTYRIYGKALT